MHLFFTHRVRYIYTLASRYQRLTCFKFVHLYGGHCFLQIDLHDVDTHRFTHLQVNGAWWFDSWMFWAAIQQIISPTLIMLQCCLLIYFINLVLSRIVCPYTFHAAGEDAHDGLVLFLVLVLLMVHLTILRLTPARKKNILLLCNMCTRFATNNPQ